MAKFSTRAFAAALIAAGAMAAAAPAAHAAPAQSVPAADYRITYEHNDAMMVPWAGSKQRVDVRVWPVDYPGMDWEVSYAGSNGGASTYEIRNLRSDLCLQPKDGATRADQRVEQARCNGRPVQQWYLPYVGGEARNIVPAKNPELGVTLENPDWTGSFLKLDYRNTSDPKFRWHFSAA